MLVKQPQVPALPALPFLLPEKQREEPSLTLRQALQTIFRGKTLLLLTTTLGLAIGAGIALAQPNVYRSLAKLMVVGGGHEGLTPDLLRQSADGSRQSPLSLRGNAIEMLQDDALQRRIVAAAGASRILAPFAPRVERDQRETLDGRCRRVIYAAQRWFSGADTPVANDESLALKAFQGGFRVEAPVETDVITISYAANDPALAQHVMKAVVVQALARHVETYSHPGHVQLAQKNRDATLRRHEEAIKALEQAGREHGIDNFTQQLAQAERLATTGEIEAGTLDEQVKVGQRRIQELDERIKALPEQVETEHTEVLPNPTRLVYQEQLDRKTRERVELQGRLFPGDPVLTRIDQEIQELRQKVEDEDRKPPLVRKTRALVPNPERLNLQRVRDDTRLQAEVDAARAQNQHALALRGRGDLQRLNKLAAGFERLQREVTSCAAALTAAEQTLSVAEKSLELTKEGVSSVKVTQEPTLPLDREGPRRTRVLFGGLLGGLFLGLAMLLVRALTDPTVRGPEDLERPFGVKVLAMIPNLHRTHVRRHQGLRVTSWN